MADKGHNSGVAHDRLKHFVDRVENLVGDRRDINADIALVLAEAKSEGFAPRIIRKIVSERGKDAHKRAEDHELFEVYTSALGYDDIFG